MRVIELRGTHRQCEREDPHFPHVTGGYPTHAWGPLNYFCLGVRGEDARFRVKSVSYGNAHWLDRALIILEEDEEV